jgi:hypothetical protein
MMRRSKKNYWLCSAALPGLIGISALGLMTVASTRTAQAVQLYDGAEYGNNLEINLDTTFSWTPIWRTDNPSARLLADSNADDGDRAEAHGLVSNLFDVIPILDIKDGDFGAHFSGEAYLNPTYLGTNQNSASGTLNYVVAKPNDIPSATRNIDGENIRLLDAFAYGSEHFGANDDQTLTVRAGRETLLWGQSLFLSNNGIAGVMAPFNILTSDNNPNAETQELIMPLGQAEVTYEPNDVVTFQGYYKFEWQPDYFPGAGSFFNTSDLVVPGASRLVAIPGFFYLNRIKDIRPRANDGQFGLSAQFTLGNQDLGLYALRADGYSPIVVTTPKLKYQLVYPRDIWVEGASTSTTIGPANVAAEVSFRQHDNLAQGSILETAANNANSNPAYPTGNTWAAQVSAILVTPGLPLDPGGITVDGEIGMNHVLAVTANKSATAWYSGLHRSSTAAQFVVVATPTYYNVLPNLKVTFPIGLHYNLYGRSEIDPTENAGTGSVNFGVTGTYRSNLIVSLVYNDNIGATNFNLPGEPSGADRNYVLLNVQYAF